VVVSDRLVIVFVEIGTSGVFFGLKHSRRGVL
jgi:hypothetical protein